MKKKKRARLNEAAADIERDIVSKEAAAAGVQEAEAEESEYGSEYESEDDQKDE